MDSGIEISSSRIRSLSVLTTDVTLDLSNLTLSQSSNPVTYSREKEVGGQIWSQIIGRDYHQMGQIILNF